MQRTVVLMWAIMILSSERSWATTLKGTALPMEPRRGILAPVGESSPFTFVASGAALGLVMYAAIAGGGSSSVETLCKLLDLPPATCTSTSNCSTGFRELFSSSAASWGSWSRFLSTKLSVVYTTGPAKWCTQKWPALTCGSEALNLLFDVSSL